MSIMTEEQVKLLHKLQMAELPAFRGINPLTLQQEEAHDFFRMNLPPLEWLDTVAETEYHEFVEKRFLGVSENNCREQMKAWLEAENLTLFQQPNPQFGAGEIWNEYFSQPMKSVNFKALSDLFERWEIPIPQIPIDRERQQVIRQKPPVPVQDIYSRLDEKAFQKELQNLQTGKGLTEGIQFGYAPGDTGVFEQDTTFYTFLSPLISLNAKELKQPEMENLAGQLQVDTVRSDIDKKPYYARLSPEELQKEIDFFQANGEFRPGIDIGYDSGTNSKSEKSVEPLVTELSDEELDQLEANEFAGLKQLRGQKLLGFAVSQTIPVFRRLNSDELQHELKTFAETGAYSSPQVSIGHIPERETHKKEFHRPLFPLSESDLHTLAKGEAIRNQELLLAQKQICRTPVIPGTPVYEKKFSALELAFDDCPEERFEHYRQYRQERDERELNKVTPEQRAVIKALQASGKGPKIDREHYLSFSKGDAATYIRENEQNPEKTFAVTVYPQRAGAAKIEAFPQFKKANLFSQPQADYLQRSIIRDLAGEGHLASPETVEELQSKLELITASQAKELIEPHLDKPAGTGLLNQCRAYIESGKILTPPKLKTIADAQNLYQVNRGFDFDKKAALRDLIEDGYIQSNDALAKIKFTTDAQDDALIAKYGDVPIGKNLRARINDLVEDARIGRIEYEDFADMSVRKGMEIISHNAEIERFKHQSRATPAQLKLLQDMEKRGQINLGKVNLNELPFRTADQWIKQNIQNPPQRATNEPDAPATMKQRNLLKLLVAHQALPSIPYPEWKALSVGTASAKISSVPPQVLQQIMAENPNRQSDAPAQQRTAMER